MHRSRSQRGFELSRQRKQRCRRRRRNCWRREKVRRILDALNGVSLSVRGLPATNAMQQFVCEFEAGGRERAGGSDPETLFPRGEFMNGTRRGQTSPDSVNEHLLRVNEEVYKAEVLIVAGTKIKHHVA